MPLIEYVTKNFRSETLDTIDQANDILHEYMAQGYDLTLRQLYYQFVARGLISNVQSEYDRLGGIVNDARLAGMIDWDHIVDRTRFLRTISSWDSPDSIIRSAAGSYAIDKWEDQPYRLEVWIEKDALVGVIDGICRALCVPHFSCRGYVSQSEAWGAAMRISRYIENGQDVRVLHLGDHDPSGIDMSRDIADRMNLFLEHHLGSDADGFQLDRLALNWDQIQQYNPPPNPVKLSDSRAGGYIAQYGRESWELDALEPAVIGSLIREAVESYRDDSLWDLAVERETEEKAGLTQASKRWDEVVSFLDEE